MGNLITSWGIFFLQSRLLCFPVLENTCFHQYYSSSWSKNNLWWSLGGVWRPGMNGQHEQESVWVIKALGGYSLNRDLSVFEFMIISVYFYCELFKARRITMYLNRAERIGTGLIFGPVGLPIIQIITIEYYQTLGIFKFYLKVRSRARLRARISGPVTI